MPEVVPVGGRVIVAFPTVEAEFVLSDVTAIGIEFKGLIAAITDAVEAAGGLLFYPHRMSRELISKRLFMLRVWATYRQLRSCSSSRQSHGSRK